VELVDVVEITACGREEEKEELVEVVGTKTSASRTLGQWVNAVGVARQSVGFYKRDD
jgi:hypothetical protein